MAYRMQMKATDAFDIKSEPGHIKDLYGETEPIGYAAAIDKVSVHDLHTTMLHLMGIDHKHLTFPSQGVEQRLSNITKKSKVIQGLLA